MCKLGTFVGNLLSSHARLRHGEGAGRRAGVRNAQRRADLLDTRDAVKGGLLHGLCDEDGEAFLEQQHREKRMPAATFFFLV